MTERYIGIENEFMSFDSSVHRVDFYSNFFDRIREPTDLKKSGSAIRTKEGLAFYVDGSEIEICTPPVALRKGFASRLTDLLMIGRDKLVEKTPELKHTGYSMHWNLTQGSIRHSKFYQGIIIPFELFGLNPLSEGMNVRLKPGRLEVLGDSIVDEKQVNATALMLGAYSLAMDYSRDAVMESAQRISGSIDNLLRKGRSSRVVVKTGEKNFYAISAHEYMRVFYDWIEPYVKALGTDEEVKNLTDFVSGKRLLENDKKDMFKRIKKEWLYSYGTFNPGDETQNLFHDRVIVASGKNRVLPPEGDLLGRVIQIPNARFYSMEWSRIELSLYDCNFGYRNEGGSGLFQVYACAARLLNREFNDVVPGNFSEIPPNFSRVHGSRLRDRQKAVFNRKKREYVCPPRQIVEVRTQ